jgi:hypothetical protein
LNRDEPRWYDAVVSGGVPTVHIDVTAGHARLAGALGEAPAWVSTRRLRWSLRLIIVVSAIAQGWHFRDFMIPDGISYLDVGDAFARGDWRTALSTYWSPLYSSMLGLANAVLQPGPRHEWLVAHAVNLATLLLALAAFEVLLDAVLAGTNGAQGPAPTPSDGDLAVLFVGYSMFAGSSLTMASVSLVTPDHLVAAAAYLLAAAIERMRTRGVSARRALGLGCLAGAAVLAKAVMLPVGLLFALSSWTALGRGRARVVAAAFVLGGFVATSGVYIIALSVAHGRLTTGDAGRLNYAWLVNHVRPWDNYQGEDPRYGTLLHPTRLISTAPRAFEFAGPIGGTYPVWFDPGYWYEGVRPVFDLAQQWDVLRQNAVRFWRDVLSTRALLAALGALVVIAALRWSRRRAVVSAWLAHVGMWLPALGALGSYLLILVEARYAAPFMTLLLVAPAAALAAGLGRRASRLTVLIFALAISVGWWKVYTQVTRHTCVSEDADVATQLGELGLRQGDHVAYIGRSFSAAFWARLARVQIIAEVPQDEAPAFWGASDASRERVLDAFRAAGARAVLTASTAPPPPPWTRVGSTSTYYRRLEPPGPRQVSSASE